MKLSEILGWPKNKETQDQSGIPTHLILGNKGFNTALTSCDREIDREALAKGIYGSYEKDWYIISESIRNIYRKEADRVISTMPTWLKRIDGK